MNADEYDLVEERATALQVARDKAMPLCESYADDLRSRGGASLPLLRQMATETGMKAAQFAKTGAAFADFQPGNSTAYKMFLYDLRRPQADALVASGRDPADARRMGPETQWGGRLLVVFPELHAYSRAMALTDNYHPSFVAEQFGFRSVGDSVPVAILLTLFGAQALVWLREAEQVAS